MLELQACTASSAFSLITFKFHLTVKVPQIPYRYPINKQVDVCCTLLSGSFSLLSILWLLTPMCTQYAMLSPKTSSLYNPLSCQHHPLLLSLVSIAALSTHFCGNHCFLSKAVTTHITPVFAPQESDALF